MNTNVPSNCPDELALYLKGREPRFSGGDFDGLSMVDLAMDAAGNAYPGEAEGEASADDVYDVCREAALDFLIRNGCEAKLAASIASDVAQRLAQP